MSGYAPEGRGRGGLPPKYASAVFGSMSSGSEARVPTQQRGPIRWPRSARSAIRERPQRLTMGN